MENGFFIQNFGRYYNWLEDRLLVLGLIWGEYYRFTQGPKNGLKKNKAKNW